MLRGKASLTVFSGEQGLSAQHLGQYAANTPDIDGFCVLFKCQHDFGRTVPTGCDVFRHEPGVVVSRGGRTGQTKVTDFQVTVCVEQEVGGLQVTVEDICGVHCFDRTQGLVDEVLAMVVGEVLGTDDSVHVSFHQFLQTH